jgi:putative transposase
MNCGKGLAEAGMHGDVAQRTDAIAGRISGLQNTYGDKGSGLYLCQKQAILPFMTRPIRIEFSGALYHVTSRGDRGQPIYEDDDDRLSFLQLLGQVVEGWNWICHAYCLMTNHYHLLIETPDGNLSKGMRQLNGVYTQASNRRHSQSGHLFQGRYKAILVNADAYLLELTRYIVLNPVRAGMVDMPNEWEWSSFRAMIGEAPVPDWLAVDGLLAQFASKRTKARQRYRDFVLAGIGQESIWTGLNRQVFLGDDSFVERMQGKLKQKDRDDLNIPKAQRRPPPPRLEELEERYDNRNQAIIVAHRTGEYSYQQIGEHFGIHFTTVGKIVRDAKNSGKNL